MLHYHVHPVNPQVRILEFFVHILKNNDGIGIYPTDTVYGMGACITNSKAIDKIGTILHKDNTRLFSFICSDFSQVSKYAKMDNTHFKIMKRYLPGPYTFILPATNIVPKKVCPKRRTVGIRIPDCITVLEIVKRLHEPLANTSLNLAGHLRGNPEYFNATVTHFVDAMLDIGPLENPQGSTIIDLTDETPKLIRQGKGSFHE